MSTTAKLALWQHTSRVLRMRGTGKLAYLWPLVPQVAREDAANAYRKVNGWGR